jgi:hypothetical protein
VNQRSYAEWREFFAANPEAASAPLWTMASAAQRNAAVTTRTSRVYCEHQCRLAEGATEWIEPVSLSRVTEPTNPYLDAEPSA